MIIVVIIIVIIIIIAVVLPEVMVNPQQYKIHA